jgi:hypothetical protein
MRALHLPKTDKLIEAVVFFVIVAPIVVISMIAVFVYASR